MLRMLRVAIAGLLVATVVTGALAQTRATAKKRTQAAPPVATSSSSNPYGLANCSERPFARDCDRRGTW